MQERFWGRLLLVAALGMAACRTIRPERSVATDQPQAMATTPVGEGGLPTALPEIPPSINTCVALEGNRINLEGIGTVTVDFQPWPENSVLELSFPGIITYEFTLQPDGSIETRSSPANRFIGEYVSDGNDDKSRLPIVDENGTEVGIVRLIAVGYYDGLEGAMVIDGILVAVKCNGNAPNGSPYTDVYSYGRLEAPPPTENKEA